jgi:diguanylate cyclase (GGDEF)-like protein/PAS domain S-box-containing protein
LFPLKGSISEVLIKTRAGLYSHSKNVEEMVQRFPKHAATVQAGIRSLMDVPLIYRDEVIASLHFRSKTPNAYTDRDLNLAERIGAQIAGAIANTQLFNDLRKTENAMRESEGRFRSLVEQAAVGVAEIEMSTGRFLTVNRRLCEMVDRREEELLTTTFQAITHPEDLHLHEEKTRMMLAGEIGHYGLEKRYLRKDGGIVWVNITVSPLWKSGEAPGRNIAVVEDITNRKLAEEALRASEERYRTLVENASDIVFRLDNTGHITFVNPAALRIMGYEEKEIIGRHYPTFIRSDMQEEAMKFFGRQFLKGIPNTYSEYPVIVKDGHEIWLGQNTQLIFQDGKVVAFQAVARDISERKQVGEALQDSEKRYRELSIVDDLTQLYNSRHFYFQLKIEVDRSNRYEQPLTLLLLDLDNFKAFNDSYGHVEGDQVLSRLGQVVKRCLRETDFAYRYGGEEFTVLLPMTTSAEGAVTAERIRTEFKKETFSPAPDQKVHVTVSIGLAQYKPQEEMKAFVHRVDQLMYQGKKSGKDRVCSEP